MVFLFPSHSQKRLGELSKERDEDTYADEDIDNSEQLPKVCLGRQIPETDRVESVVALKYNASTQGHPSTLV